MNKEELKKLFENIDKRLILHNTIKEPISKDLENLIKLSVAYEDLQQENANLKQALIDIKEYIEHKQEIQHKYKFALSHIECDDILQIIDKFLDLDKVRNEK